MTQARTIADFVSGTTIPANLKTYRQALRDITDSYSSLGDVVWPTKP